MRKSQDLNVIETLEEFNGFISDLKWKVVSKHKSKKEYVNLTATFDVETTNTKYIGFAYSFQF